MIARRAGVHSRDLEGGELALFKSEDSQLILLNEVGAAVWELCDGTRDVGAIAAILQEPFAEMVGPDRVQSDVAAFVARLLELGAVEEH